MARPAMARPRPLPVTDDCLSPSAEKTTPRMARMRPTKGMIPHSAQMNPASAMPLPLPAPPPGVYQVTPHGPIERVDDNLWSVESAVPGIPGGPFPRRMSIVRLGDGTLLLHNAIPLDEAGLAALHALGRPSLLVTPSPLHCLDANAVRERFGVRLLCPAGAARAVRERTAVDGTLEELPRNPAVRFEPLGGVPSGEGVLVVTSGAGEVGARLSLLLGDVLLNVPHLPGFWGFVYRLGGFTGRAKCGPIWLKRAVADRAALRASLERLATTPGLHRLVPSHGPVIERDPGRVLVDVARDIKG